MSKTQALGIALSLWLLSVIAVINLVDGVFEKFLFVILFLIAFGLTTWEEKK